MKTHRLKTWPEFFCAVDQGIKPFEVRFDDRDIATGDLLVLREWEPQSGLYTGREVAVKVTYRLALPDSPGLGWVGRSSHGEWVVLGIEATS